MAGPRAREISLFDPQILSRAALDSLRKLAPRAMAKCPAIGHFSTATLRSRCILARLRLPPRAVAGTLRLRKLGRAGSRLKGRRERP